MSSNTFRLKLAAAVATPVLILASTSVAWATGDGEHRVTLCHVKSGKTITVDKHAAKAHFAHGDSKGECAEPDPEPTTQEPTEDPEPTTDPEPTEEPEPTDEPTTQEPSEEPEPSTPTNTEQPSEPSGESEPSQPTQKPSRTSEPSSGQPDKSSKPSTRSHRSSSKQSVEQPNIDRDGNGVRDITVNPDGTPVSETGK